ncbi:MAG: hypothetical protein M1827_006013 [Pycnora praestabilis]|nr:MAG: hypothetical protein M1827_006013 [Pycnora praestabilis]
MWAYSHHTVLYLFFFYYFVSVNYAVDITVSGPTMNLLNGALALAQTSTCRNILPGICCIGLPPDLPTPQRPNVAKRQRGLRERPRRRPFSRVIFHDLESLDIGATWLGSFQGNDPTQWTSGCTGRVGEVAIGPGTKEVLGINDPGAPVPVTSYIWGANYLRLSPSDAALAAAQGLRAFLGGGGAQFQGQGEQIATPGDGGQSGSAGGGNEASPSSPGGAATDALGTTQWVYPDVVDLNGVSFTQQDGPQSVVYQSAAGYVLDYEDDAEVICSATKQCFFGMNCIKKPVNNPRTMYGTTLVGQAGYCSFIT